MSDFVTSLIRTWVPIFVGAFVTWLLSHGIALDANTTSGFVGFLTALFSGVYYVVVRALEQKYPQIGWLLGQAKQVNYKETK